MSNYVKKVAIVGAGGNVGKYIVESLLQTGKHTVTAITRSTSKSTVPAGVNVARVDYDDHASLVKAVAGHQALIITMSVTAPPEQQSKLIEAAAEANIPYVLPNEWGTDGTNEQLGKDTFIGQKNAGYRAYIEKLGKSAWIGVCSSFWYEWSLAGGPERYGFDIPKREVIFFDDGNTRINTTTWPQSGRTAAALLSLDEATLAKFKNNWCFVSSFSLTQREMFEAVKRVSGTSDQDWKISFENSTERYNSGVEMMKAGNRMGFSRLLYTRMFYPNGDGFHEGRHELHNDFLGLPKEDLDEETKRALGMVEELANF